MDKGKGKGKGLDRPWGLQEVETTRFQDIRHMKVVSLSALRKDCIYPPGNIPGTHFYQRLSLPQGYKILIFLGAAARRGVWSPHSRGFSRSHTTDATQSVGLLWTSDQLVAQNSTWQHTTLNNKETSMPPLGFEPKISADERSQTYVIDRAATGIGVQRFEVFEKHGFF